MTPVEAVAACGIECTESDLPLVRGLIERRMGDTAEGQAALAMIDAPPRITVAAYSSIDAVNYSSLKDMEVSALRYKHRLSVPRKDTDSMRCGRLDHAAILEPETVATWPMWTGGDRKAKAIAEFIAKHGEDYIWKDQEITDARALSAAVHAHPEAGPLVRTPGAVESPLIWTEPTTGIVCKSRPDKRLSDRLLEIKTSKLDLSARMIQKQITGYRYHAQAAFYLDASGLDQFTWIFVEQSAPHDVAVVHASQDWIDAGRAMYRGWLERLAECRRTNTWPGVCSGAMEIEVPSWVMPGSDDPGLDMTALEGL